MFQNTVTKIILITTLLLTLSSSASGIQVINFNINQILINTNLPVSVGNVLPQMVATVLKMLWSPVLPLTMPASPGDTAMGQFSSRMWWSLSTSVLKRGFSSGPGL